MYTRLYKINTAIGIKRLNIETNFLWEVFWTKAFGWKSINNEKTRVAIVGPNPKPVQAPS
jgi:hypothetical protein